MAYSLIKESELVLPSLYLLDMSPQGCLSTTDLIGLLAKILHPQGLDLEILSKRKDTHFSQKVRNLKSHNTLTKYGYAEYSDGKFFITEKGRQLIERNKSNLQYILSSAFEYDDIKESLGKVYKSRASVIIPLKELVSEGEAKFTITKSYERSRKLRNAAVEHFTHNGIIVCDCCGFEFRSFYGERFGVSCIEIHHLKPVFQYASMSLVQTIDEALKNLLPVCPNCHRVIHKNNITAEMIPLFKKGIDESKGRF